jgi:hypothetical protein
MRMRAKKRMIAVILLTLTGAAWIGLRHNIAKKREAAFTEKLNECKRRDAEVERQFEIIKRDASDQLKIGTGKVAIARFFASHGIPFTVSPSEVIGTLHTHGGCPPQGCGTDRYLIGVRVKVNTAGVAISDPVVVALYEDCV